MNIAILGSGNVGGALGARWARGGHKIIFSTRDPQSAKITALVTEAGPTARAASAQEAIDASEIILLATPWKATQEVLASVNGLAGKVLIDATNPVLPDLSALALGTTTSAGEMVAHWTPGARVVKAFNTIGANIMANPAFSSKVALFYCGDDAAAKAQVRELAAELGFDPLDAGRLTQARVLEPFALLWISLAFAAGFGREIAFQFMRR